MEKEKVPSKYQVEIDHVYTSTNKNIIVKAGPGSGKSYTILQLLKKTPKFLKCILVAFNKSIQTELASKVPDNVKVSTIHSLAYSVLRRNYSANFKLNQYKNYIIGKKVLKMPQLKDKDKDIYLFNLSKIIDLSRMNLASSKEEVEAVCSQYNISTVNGEINDVITLMDELDEYNSRDHKDFMIDFTDMLWLCYKKVKRQDYPKYNVVFCDELQDLNPLQKTIVENIISPTNGRFIGVGDPRQSIYAFMGANIEAFKSFENRPNTVILPLSVTYRCSKKVTAKANEIFDGLEPFEDNVEGEIRKGTLEEVADGDFVICRNNLPLVMAWLDIVQQGKKCHILGKEFGKNLLAIIAKLAKYPDYLLGVADLMDKKEEELKSKGVGFPKRHATYVALVEKLNIIEVLKKTFGSFERMENKMEDIFNDEETGGVILMTGHKAKGLETDRVFFLQSGLIPSKYAESIDELNQERCLQYVIITRAKRDLIYVD